MKTIVGNWKMNGEPGMAAALAAAIVAGCGGAKAQAVLCPPFVLMDEVQKAIAGSNVKMGGQDCSAEERGAYTGDIGALMLKASGCAYVIVGHSERRIYHGETNTDVHKKALRAIINGLIPIICVGETLQERESGRAEEIVGRQVRESVPDSSHQPLATSHFLLAYEPVWAIGSGKTPTTDDIARMHAYIKGLARAKVLYGGSVNAANAKAILATPGVDGALVGGASLKAEEFIAVLRAAEAAAQDL